MRVLVAPDKFRGTLTARQAAEAMAAGWMAVRPGDRIDLLPIADGGEGTLETLVAAMGGRTRSISVSGPLGDPLEAPVGFVEGAGGRLAIVESASASGLMLVSSGRRNPMRASSRGTGELMLAALDEGADRLLVCLGGTAMTDGGTGMASALGVRFLDREGAGLPPGGGALLDLARIDTAGIDPRVRSTQVTGATDIQNVLTGPSGASFGFAAQKGAGPEDMLLLDRALGHLAAIVHRDLGVSPKEEPGAASGGGLGFGLIAFCGGRLRPGVEVVMDAVGFLPRLQLADLVITGEGSLDQQTLHGKVPAGVLRAAELLRKPMAIICGRAEIQIPGVDIVSLVDRVGPEVAIEEPRRAVEEAAQELAGRVRDLAR